MTTETTDLDTVRRETEAWVRARLPESWVRIIDSGATGTDPALADPAAAREWYTALCERGWAVPHWPVEYGGAGLSDAEAAVVAAVIARYRADLPGPYFVSRTLIGPTVMAWGSPEQRRHYLPGIAAGTDVWCQLFSEPGAGSDLAGLATRATPDGDRWIVRGQKVWSSFADQARYGMLLARTHPERPKHAGISCFLLDMRTPGVTVRPLRQLTGEQHFCEVFLDEVVVPDTVRLGGVGEGWRVALSTLSAERSGLSDSSEASGVPLAPVLALARTTGGWRDPVLRDRLTALLVTERALHLTNLRNRASAADGARGSITKLAQSELSQRISEIGYEIAGARAAYSDDVALTPEAYALLDSRRLTIAGGTSEIQRTIIAERVLGLDREPDPDRGRPWNETRHG
ncbi:acyl-CoA dehydrogenase family protein [Nocardia otitidiscaviarum]|uniref:acyl-CoA dehydrogenase family protein n=1 Tax=Nocardia otitidiscaviarum TaxID=1823 RepID=UPI002456E746|nr:acyl-CoA dehydrogenase family protein [Nocardia otitidiscaviarum]